MKKGYTCLFFTTHEWMQQVRKAQEKNTLNRWVKRWSSNRSYAEWGEVLGNPVIATAILDRLLHHRTAFRIQGDSYRLKEKRKAGLLSKPAKESD